MLRYASTRALLAVCFIIVSPCRRLQLAHTSVNMLDVHHDNPLAACAQVIDAFTVGTPSQRDNDAACEPQPSLCSRHDGAWSHHALAVDDVLCYPVREVTAVTRYLVVARSTLDKLMSTLVFAVDGPATGARLCDDHLNITSDTADPAATASVPLAGDSVTTFAQLDHRNQRLQVLGARIEQFWDTILPPVAAIRSLGDVLRSNVETCLNPFGFPEIQLPIVVGHAALDAEVMQRGEPQPRDVDVVSSSELVVVFRRFTQGFQSAVLQAVAQFQRVPVGSEGAAIGLEGAPFHGQMPEVRQLWQRLVGTAEQLSSMGCVLRSCIASKRRERGTMVALLERGALDDIWSCTVDPLQQQEQQNAPLQLPASLMRLATTRLQMQRLALLVATCRALDASGAEAAIQKIQFENDRRASMRDQDIAAAAAAHASHRRRSSALQARSDAMPAQSIGSAQAAEVEDRTISPTTTSSATQDVGEGDARGKPPQARRRSLFATDSESNTSGWGQPPQVDHSHRAVYPPHCSIIPPTTLMDLEMVARAYNLDIPPCTLPRCPLDAESSDADLVRAAHAAEGRQRAQLVQKARRTSNTSGIGHDADSALARLRSVYAANRSDAGMMTTDCLVIKRMDRSSQTSIAGTVYEARIMEDIASELQEARALLSERTQQLMLERQRSEVLLVQLDRLQRQRQDFARRSAAAGGTVNRGGGDGALTLGGGDSHTLGLTTSLALSDEGVRSHDSSPIRCISPVEGKEALTGLRLVDSAVDLRLRAAREYDATRSARALSPPASIPRQRSAGVLRGATSPPPATNASTPDRSNLANTVGPIVTTFALRGRLDRMPTEAPSCGRLGSAAVPPLNPTDLLQVPTADARRGGSASQRSPLAKLEETEGAVSPSATLDRQFGALFARKLRALETHANKLVECKQEQDYWSGKKEVKAVVVPVGIDPRHARAFVPPAATSPGIGLRGPTAGATNAMKSTHYGTVGSIPRRQF